ncbi:hypothetical protein ACM9ZQ_19070 [Escherichia coli]|uniref:hypothetical protein n=1 Tax=Escherichia coli TaxID=562 RepID=UPI0011E9B054|nr:hypothetical protein [Escherichia coli]EGB2672721.1 hypothetical protein [Escherichia coli]EJA1216565.1 hypothetical protein [Escherichia coli]MCZ0571152.1 hypothetical protein [Escherichia coli]HAI7179499.1 hypothetical protein [Escherichia coli]HAW3000207.1 hypothetical protein [Escherichia coli]
MEFWTGAARSSGPRCPLLLKKRSETKAMQELKLGHYTNFVRYTFNNLRAQMDFIIDMKVRISARRRIEPFINAEKENE